MSNIAKVFINNKLQAVGTYGSLSHETSWATIGEHAVFYALYSEFNKIRMIHGDEGDIAYYVGKNWYKFVGKRFNGISVSKGWNADFFKKFDDIIILGSGNTSGTEVLDALQALGVEPKPVIKTDTRVKIFRKPLW